MDKDNFSALSHACGNGHFHVARLLLAYDADINHRWHNSCDEKGEISGLSALDWACLRSESTAEDEELWEYLVTKGAHLQDELQASPNAAAPTPRQQTNLLHHAASSGHLAVLKFGIKHDLRINQKSNKGETPLVIAIRDKVDIDVIYFLLDNSADVHEEDCNGNSVLHLATLGGVEMAELVLGQFSDVNVLNSKLETPLAFLIKSEHEDLAMTNFLVRRGADLKTKDEEGNNLLHLAVRSGSSLFARFAIENHIKVGELTTNNQSALDYAYLYTADESIFKLLRDALREELPRCSSCLEDAAHIQFLPCRHQYACTGCCGNWKVCKCQTVIVKKVDVLFDERSEASKEMAPDPHAQEIERLMNTKEEMQRERDDETARRNTDARIQRMERWDLERKSEELARCVATLSKENDGYKTCPICMERQRNRVFQCGHTCCEYCSLRMSTCHTCRSPIDWLLKLFL